MSLEHISQQDLLFVWGELVEAYHGVNGFGGNTAEIYAYRFGGEINRDAPRFVASEREKQQRDGLLRLLELFAEHYGCFIWVNDCALSLIPRDWMFNWRCHVRIQKSERGRDGN